MDDPEAYNEAAGARRVTTERYAQAIEAPYGYDAAAALHGVAGRSGLPALEELFGPFDSKPVLTPTGMLHKDRKSRENRLMQEGMILPKDAAARKSIPLTSGVLDYFPLAIAYVAMISKAGNDQHNPGQPLHWARGKSADHADCIPRHLVDRGTNDTDGLSHTGKLAWRSLALLQEELEERIANGEDPFKTAEK